MIDARVRGIDTAITRSREITPNSLKATQSVSNLFLTPHKGHDFKLMGNDIAFLQSKSKKCLDNKNTGKDDN